MKKAVKEDAKKEGKDADVSIIRFPNINCFYAESRVLLVNIGRRPHGFERFQRSRPSL